MAIINLTSINKFETSFNAGNSSIKNSPGQVIAPNYILVIIIGILAVGFNGLLLIAMLRNKLIIFTSNGAYLVANLTVADLLTGLNAVRYGCMPAEANISAIVEMLLLSLFWASVQASLLTTFVMSLERYVAIVYPFKATLWLSKKRTFQSIVAIWFLSCISGVLKKFYNDYMTIGLTVFFELTVLVTIFLYYKIFIVLAERKRLLKVQLSLLPTTSHGLPSHKDLQRECQLTNVVALLTIIMIVTVLPYLIGGQIFISYKLSSSGPDSSNSVILQFVVYYLPVELTNFVLNPIVYAWRLPKYRRALLRTIQCCQRASPHSEVSD